MDHSTLTRARSRGSAPAGALEGPAGVAGAAAGAPSLGIHARIASRSPVAPLPEALEAQRDAALVQRFTLQAAARELLPRERVASCMWRPIPARESIEVYHAPRTSSAHFGGLQVCGSVWCCPVCAVKVSERRRVELHGGIETWLCAACGHRLVLATFTLQHRPSDALGVVLGRLKVARRDLTSGRAAKAFNGRYGVAGSIRTLEVTHGANGWHPHLHVLLFLERDVAVESLRDELGERWPQCVAAAGGYAGKAGCDVRHSDRDIAEYVSKWGKQPRWTTAHEMTKAVTKKGHESGRTPTELLMNYVDQDAAAGRLWMQYACTMKGERQLWWSHGLRKRLGLVVVEQSDEELAVAQDEDAQLLGVLSLYQWRVVRANDARAEVLQAARSGDWMAVHEVLKQLGAV